MNIEMTDILVWLGKAGKAGMGIWPYIVGVVLFWAAIKRFRWKAPYKFEASRSLLRSRDKVAIASGLPMAFIVDIAMGVLTAPAGLRWYFNPKKQEQKEIAREAVDKPNRVTNRRLREIRDTLSRIENDLGAKLVELQRGLMIIRQTHPTISDLDRAVKSGVEDVKKNMT